jgi:type I restriction enzyme S subunit
MKQWPRARLGDVAPLVRRSVDIDLNASYPELGIRSFGKGTFHKPPLSGADVGSKRLFRIEPGDLVLSNVFSWEGAVAIATKNDEGRFGSHRFITCDVDRHRAEPMFLCTYLARTEDGLDQLRQASPGGAGRNRTLGLGKLAEIEVPLPPLAEQQAMVAHLDALVDKTRQLTEHLNALEADADHLLALRFHDAIAHVPYRSMGEVAPVVRRSVLLDSTRRYREVGARSFGKGLFAKPDFDAAGATWEKPVWIEAGDLVLSNIKAWERAIALADDTHHDSIASHRYITCVVNQSQLRSSFLLYYLLSEEGLERVGDASPGTADRNRTLSLGNLAKIEVPVPPLATQQAFVDMKAHVHALKASHAAIRASNAALLPATLERLFA